MFVSTGISQEYHKDTSCLCSVIQSYFGLAPFWYSVRYTSEIRYTRTQTFTMDVFAGLCKMCMVSWQSTQYELCACVVVHNVIMSITVTDRYVCVWISRLCVCLFVHLRGNDITISAIRGKATSFSRCSQVNLKNVTYILMLLAGDWRNCALFYLRVFGL